MQPPPCCLPSHLPADPLLPTLTDTCQLWRPAPLTHKPAGPPAPPNLPPPSPTPSPLPAPRPHSLCQLRSQLSGVRLEGPQQSRTHFSS